MDFAKSFLLELILSMPKSPDVYTSSQSDTLSLDQIKPANNTPLPTDIIITYNTMRFEPPLIPQKSESDATRRLVNGDVRGFRPMYPRQVGRNVYILDPQDNSRSRAEKTKSRTRKNRQDRREVIRELNNLTRMLPNNPHLLENISDTYEQ